MKWANAVCAKVRRSNFGMKNVLNGRSIVSAWHNSYGRNKANGRTKIKGGVRTLADYPRAHACACYFIWSFVLLYSQKIGGDFTVRSLRSRWGRNSCVRSALFCIWGPHKFSIFGDSGSSSRLMTQASFIATCLLNANRLLKHSCAFQSQHLLSRCIYCSR